MSNRLRTWFYFALSIPCGLVGVFASDSIAERYLNVGLALVCLVTAMYCAWRDFREELAPGGDE